MSKESFTKDMEEVASNWVKWGQVGDWIGGALLSKREVKNNLPNAKNLMQTVYEFKAMDGEFHEILEDKSVAKESTKIEEGQVWMVGGKEGINAQMRNIKIGQIVALEFAESVPSKTKGYAPTKIIKVRTSGKIDEDVVAEASKADFGDFN